jgi:hypothetical protein
VCVCVGSCSGSCIDEADRGSDYQAGLFEHRTLEAALRSAGMSRGVPLRQPSGVSFGTRHVGRRAGPSSDWKDWTPRDRIRATASRQKKSGGGVG